MHKKGMKADEIRTTFGERVSQLNKAAYIVELTDGVFGKGS